VRRALGFAVAATAALALGTGPASAGNGFAMAVDVRNTHEALVDASSGTCTWQVTSEVTLVNLSGEDLTISAVSGAVGWSASDGSSGFTTNVRILNANGLEPGATVPAGQQRGFSNFVVEFGIPCRADNGDLAVRVTTQKGTSSGDAPFLENGTPVSVAAAGALGLGSIAGGALIVVQRRRRRLAVVT
jgi:hypothetical protein